MIIPSNAEIAVHAANSGVDRIFLDQEQLGKQARQGHLDTHMSTHSLDEITAISSVVQNAEIMVRLNPTNPNTPREVDAAIEAGAQRLMLPMFVNARQVSGFMKCVADRVPVTLLCETPQALVRLRDWIPVVAQGEHEVHIGLNDLSIGMGLDFLFEPLAGRVLDFAAELLNVAEINWGFGGIGINESRPIDPDMLIGEHVRLGSHWLILSRAFHGQANSLEQFTSNVDIRAELSTLEHLEQKWRNASSDELMKNCGRLAVTIQCHVRDHY